MAKITLSDVTSGFQSTTAYNTNINLIEDELNNKVLYRDNPSGEPNQMQNNIDLNSNDLLNVQSLDVQSLSIAGIPAIPEGLVAGEIPVQTGNADKFLTTNGTVVSWNHLDIRTFNTVSDMIDSASLVVGQHVRTLGYNSIGDGGDNVYEIVAAATGTDDGGSFIDLTTHQAKGLFPRGKITDIQFGVIADGTTVNDTALINANTFAAGRRIDFIGSGVRGFNTLSLTVAPNWRGDGLASLKQLVVAGNAITCTSLNDIKIKGLIFDGNKSAQSTQRDLLRFVLCNNVVVENNEFQNAIGPCIRVLSCNDLDITHNDFHDNQTTSVVGRNEIAIDWNASPTVNTNIKVRNNTMFGGIGSGGEPNNVAILMLRTNGGIIAGNEIDNYASEHIQVETVFEDEETDKTLATRNIKIHDNVCKDTNGICNSSGIHLGWGTESCEVYANTVIGIGKAGGATNHGILISPFTRFHKVWGNTLKDNKDSGIRIRGATAAEHTSVSGINYGYHQIYGNTIESNGSDSSEGGVFMTATTNQALNSILFSDNNILNNTGPGFKLGGTGVGEILDTKIIGGFVGNTSGTLTNFGLNINDVKGIIESRDVDYSTCNSDTATLTSFSRPLLIATGNQEVNPEAPLLYVFTLAYDIASASGSAVFTTAAAQQGIEYEYQLVEDRTATTKTGTVVVGKGINGSGNTQYTVKEIGGSSGAKGTLFGFRVK